MALSKMGEYPGKMNIYLGIDPGTSKAGWAFVSADGDLLLSGIISRNDFGSFLSAIENSCWIRLYSSVIEGSIENLPDEFCPEILLGGGTSSSFFLSTLEVHGYRPTVVSEYGSTLGARPLYWDLHPPKGIRKFIPLSLQVPPRAIDDLAAWKIVLNALDITQ